MDVGPRDNDGTTPSMAAVKTRAYARAGRDGLLSLVVGLAEAPLIWAFATGRLSLIGTLLCHMIVLGVLMLVLVGRTSRNGNGMLPLIHWLAIAALGPIGGIVGALFAFAVERSRVNDDLLTEWYARISRSIEMESAVVMSERVAVDRMIETGAPAPRSFAGVIENGSIPERQAALGHIARHFHVDYLPALGVALKSPEPVIRVQAAAAAAKVKAPLRADLEILFAQAENMLSGECEPTAALALSHRLVDITAIALVDDAEKKRGQRLAAALNERSLDILGRVFVSMGGAQAAEAKTASDAAIAALPEASARALEELLLKRGYFAQFRQLRSVRDYAAGGATR